MFEMWATPTSVTLQYPIRLSDVSGKSTCVYVCVREKGIQDFKADHTHTHVHTHVLQITPHSLANNTVS